jgi:hypothetical protein
VTASPDKLTTDPPRPPGTPDVDALVGDPVPDQDTGAPRTEPDDEDVTGADRTAADADPEDDDAAGRSSDTVSVEPPD